MSEAEPSVDRQEPETIQVVMSGPFLSQFKMYLAARRLHLAGPIPVEAGGDPDDLPTYIIGIDEDFMQEIMKREREGQ